MALVHITRGPRVKSPWLPLPTANETVITDCCVCRVPVRHAEYRVLSDIVPSYYDPIVEVACRTGRGCKHNPRKKNGAALRAMTVKGA